MSEHIIGESITLIVHQVKYIRYQVSGIIVILQSPCRSSKIRNPKLHAECNKDKNNPVFYTTTCVDKCSTASLIDRSIRWLTQKGQRSGRSG